MDVSAATWLAWLAVFSVVIVADLWLVSRRPHFPSTRESALLSGFYVVAASAFGVWIWLDYGSRRAGEFFAGYVTEYSLSVDNLFVFIILMSAFSVPKVAQQKILIIGIVIAIVLRGVFIALGAALIHYFIWMFYIFGVFLVFTAIKLARHKLSDEYKENRLVKGARKVLPVTRTFYGSRILVKLHGRRFATPLLIAVVAIGTTDIVFAVDSIPAIFGLTKEPFLVLTANVFALMGLAQLYFLLGKLLERLVYLSYGLAVILGFIGVKLFLEALHDNNLPFVNNGQPVAVPEVSISFSLTFIVAVLAVTTVASLLSRENGRREAIRRMLTTAPHPEETRRSS
ncbi:MAG: TerC/Alx family metal homeostasis membrane protein [Stackebrandtia sp.]